MNAADSKAAKAIRRRIHEQYVHMMECLRLGDHNAAGDHAREMRELIHEHPCEQWYKNVREYGNPFGPKGEVRNSS